MGQDLTRKRLLDVDSLTGVHTYHHYDPLTDITHIEKVQDVGPIIERNKQYHLTDHQKNGIKRSWMHAATVPNIIIEKWLNEDGINFFDQDHWPAVKRKLNDPDWKYLTTGTAKI